MQDAEIPVGLTFDDVLLVPAHSQVLPKEVDLSTQLTKTITLNIPLLSAAMDTVTESRTAIAMAREGGLGIIHKNMSSKSQAIEVDQASAAEGGDLDGAVGLPHGIPGVGDQGVEAQEPAQQITIQ